VRQLKLTVNARNAPAKSLSLSKGFTCYGAEPDANCIDDVHYDEEFYMLRLDTAE
jgi:hypothetical protein